MDDIEITQDNYDDLFSSFENTIQHIDLLKDLNGVVNGYVDPLVDNLVGIRDNLKTFLDKKCKLIQCLCNPAPDECRPEMCKACEYTEEKQRERGINEDE